MKTVPMRTCVVTREKLTKAELIRIVRTPEGEIVIDKTGKINGRGAYVKNDPEIIKKASKALSYHLKTKINDEIILELLK